MSTQNVNSEFNTPLMVITGLLITLYIVSNIMAVKLVSGFDITFFDAGTITFPFAYMLGDVLTEVWGFRISRKVIFLTFFCNIVAIACTTCGVFLPSPDYMMDVHRAYRMIFLAVPRILAASLIGFLCGELSNAWMMVKIKAWTRGRFLWIRTIGSSMIGYLFDTVMFVILAFAGTCSGRELLSMIVIQYFLKLGLEAVFGTPMAYALIAGLKHQWNPDSGAKN